ncbi:GATA transcription factor 9-like [Benincasa hispida]|uniref:GATA transcription factor 9-like n=1 Tax=Benincasa hispida TaxID=102211 RepID=UPI0019020D15|nr:GATA transcription factor 9-like [Benincasa hispida]
MEGPEYFQPGFCSQFPTENRQSSDANKTTVVPSSAAAATADHFIVEDLLDFSNDDDVVFTDGTFDNQTPTSTDSSTLTLLDSCNSYPNFEQHNNGHNYNFADANFSTDLGVPYDDLAELEWLSNFVEDSFSADDLEKLSLISGMNSRTDHEDDASKTREFQTGLNRNHSPGLSVPAKAARSKRSRAAPCIWNSRLSVLSPTNSSSETDVVVTLTPHPNTAKKTAKKKETPDDTSSAGNGEGRKCLHCATDKTPQWRTGPMGPKTLCNACGVRYKSGRLVPEYRPAASPTFVLTKHSNSHRKVMELRRQKEMMRAQQQQQYLHHESMGFDHVSNDDDYLIHQHIGPLYQ